MVHRFHLGRRVAAIGLIVVLHPAAACSMGASSDVLPAPSVSAAPPAGPAPLARCAEGPETRPDGPLPDTLHRYCGRVMVTIDGQSRTVAIGFVADRPANPLAGRSVLVYHPGGPGLSPLRHLFESPPVVDYRRYAVLAWNGATSSSVTGACGPNHLSFAADRGPHFAQRAEAAARECLARPRDYPWSGARAAADELEAVRASLGLASVDLLTHSYGTAIAEAYLQRYPHRVGRAVLDGPIATDATWQDRIDAVSASTSSVLRKLFDSCATGCAPGVTGALGGGRDYTAVRSALLAARPRVGNSQVRLTGAVLDQATLIALRSDEYWPAYLDALERAFGGDATELWTLGERYITAVDRRVFYAAMCTDIDHPRAVEDYNRYHAPLLDAYAAELAPCAAYQHVLSPVPKPAPESPDVLVIASPFDVLTPAALVASSPRLSRYPLCVTGVAAHTNIADPRVDRIVAGFLAGGSADQAKADCMLLARPG